MTYHPRTVLSVSRLEPPEAKLADLMARDLGVTISARELRMFIRANWRKVSVYAHAIHGLEGQQRPPHGGAGATAGSVDEPHGGENGWRPSDGSSAVASLDAAFAPSSVRLADDVGD